MKITYDSTEAFYNGIYECVTKGLEFEVDGSSLTIVLTGGLL
jgi:hypothetical protein